MTFRTFTLLFQVGPPGLFGLPNGDKLVIGSEAGRQGIGNTLDTKTGNIVGYGTLSQYRREDEALRLECNIGGAQLSVNDNFFRLKVMAASRAEALRIGTTLFERLVRFLGIEYGGLFFYETLQIASEDGEVEARPGPKQFQLFEGTIYNLKQLAEKIRQAATFSRLDDDRVTKALIYHEHAQFLFAMRPRLSMFCPHFSYLLTSAYLHLWKAITVILGEPGTDADYQRRYQTYGLPKNFWMDELKPLQDVRNRFDVAHYSMDAEAVQQVEGFFGRANQVCQTVIKAYVAHLLRTAAPADPIGQ